MCIFVYASVKKATYTYTKIRFHPTFVYFCSFCYSCNYGLPDVLIDFTFLFNFCRTFVHLLSTFCPPIVHFCNFCYLCLPNFLIEFNFCPLFVYHMSSFHFFVRFCLPFVCFFHFFNVFSTLTVSTYFLLSPFLWLPDIYVLLGTIWLRAGIVADLIVFLLTGPNLEIKAQ